MIGTYNRSRSSDKSNGWDLDNGAFVLVTNSQWYGDFVTCIEFGGAVWHCSNGKDTLPGFAKPWVDLVGRPCSDSTLVRPNFEKEYPGRNGLFTGWDSGGGRISDTVTP